MQHPGIEDLAAYTQSHNWPHNLLDEALRVYPVDHDEYCNNAVCIVRRFYTAGLMSTHN